MHSLTIINPSQTFLISHNTFAVIIMKEPIPWFILHALDASSKNPFAELIINSADTDVFLQLVYYQTKLCIKTLVRSMGTFKKYVRSRFLSILVCPCLLLSTRPHNPHPPLPSQVRLLWLELTLSPFNFYTCEI